MSQIQELVPKPHEGWPQIPCSTAKSLQIFSPKRREINVNCWNRDHPYSYVTFDKLIDWWNWRVLTKDWYHCQLRKQVGLGCQSFALFATNRAVQRQSAIAGMTTRCQGKVLDFRSTGRSCSASHTVALDRIDFEHAALQGSALNFYSKVKVLDGRPFLSLNPKLVSKFCCTILRALHISPQVARQHLLPQAFPKNRVSSSPPLCPLANIFCSPAHMVMTFSLKVCGTVTLRIHRRVTWMTTRWATHKSNQKRLVTEKRANSHSCNALLFSSTCRLCVIWQSDLDGLSHGCLSCYDLWFMSNVSCTEKYLGYWRKVLLKQRTDLTLLKREICIIECNAFYRIALMLEGISACQGIYGSVDLTQPI